MKTFKFLMLFVAMATILTSCKDEDESDGKAKVTLTFTPQAGSSDVALNQQITVNGNKISLSTAKFYISDIRLVDHEGVEFPVDTVLLITLGAANTFDLGQFGADHYHELKFKIGVDSVTNHSDPSTRAAGSPLADANMHWDWAMGYRFLVLEGTADTTGAATPTLDLPLAYHVGGDSYYQDIEIDADLETDGETDATLNVTIDYAKFFTGVDFKTESHTHTMDNMMLANKMAANTQTVFTVE